MGLRCVRRKTFLRQTAQCATRTVRKTNQSALWFSCRQRHLVAEYAEVCLVG